MRNIKQDLKSGNLLKNHLLRKGNNLQEVVEEYILFLFLFLSLFEEAGQEAELPIGELNPEANDYTGEATQGVQNMDRTGQKATHRRHMTTTLSWQWRQILNSLSKVLREILILLSIKMNRPRDLRSRTKRIIWNDCVWKGQRQRQGQRQGNIIKVKRCNRDAMALRAV